MRRSSTAVSGIGAAVSIVVGLLLLVMAEPDAKTDEEILSFYADGGNRAAEIAGFFVVVFGAVLFLWFAHGLLGRLRTVQPGPRPLADLGFGAAVVATGLLVAAAATLSSVSFTREVASQFELDPGLAHLTVTTGYLLLMGSVLVSCVLIASTSLLAFRTDVLPRWMGWLGVAFIALAIIEMILLPVFTVPVWVVIVSVVVMREVTAGPESTDDVPARVAETVAIG